jgi:hypothetical protein
MFFRIAIITLLFMGFLSSLFGCSNRTKSKVAVQVFTELSPEDAARLQQQRAVISDVARRRYGTPGLTGTRADLAVLQRLIDDKVFAKTQTYELQCLGVTFGDVLTSELPLRWVMVTDPFGTDPSLRYKDTTIQINALTMISKRVEDDREANLADLVAGIRYSLNQMVESGNYK